MAVCLVQKKWNWVDKGKIKNCLKKWKIDKKKIIWWTNLMVEGTGNPPVPYERGRWELWFIWRDAMMINVSHLCLTVSGGFLGSPKFVKHLHVFRGELLLLLLLNQGRGLHLFVLREALCDVPEQPASILVAATAARAG